MFGRHEGYWPGGGPIIHRCTWSIWGATSSLPEEPSALNILTWLKSNFAKLPNFVGGAVDFGALASATNFSKMLKQDGCLHIEGLKEKSDLEGPVELGVTSHGVRRSVRNFIKLF